MARPKKDTTDTTQETTTETTLKGGVTEQQFKDFKHKWVKWMTETRCYVEGIYLEAGQPVTFSPAASYRQRVNKNIRTVEETTWPTLTKEQIADLTEGDPKVGAAPKEFTLVQPGSGAAK